MADCTKLEAYVSSAENVFVIRDTRLQFGTAGLDLTHSRSTSFIPYMEGTWIPYMGSKERTRLQLRSKSSFTL